MLQNKFNSEMKVKTNSANSKFSTKHVQIQQLQDEIDKLAILVSEAKRQSDRIQAAADALGDAVLGDLDPGLISLTTNDKKNRARKTDN
jgi:hypothetical protein